MGFLRVEHMRAGRLVGSDLLLGVDKPVCPGNVFLRRRGSERRGVLRFCLGVEAGDERLEECAPVG